jgi:hypothetical protein
MDACAERMNADEETESRSARDFEPKTQNLGGANEYERRRGALYKMHNLGIPTSLYAQTAIVGLPKNTPFPRKLEVFAPYSWISILVLSRHCTGRAIEGGTDAFQIYD